MAMARARGRAMRMTAAILMGLTFGAGRLPAAGDEAVGRALNIVRPGILHARAVELTRLLCQIEPSGR